MPDLHTGGNFRVVWAMASGVAVLSCGSGQASAGIEPAAYYTVDWSVVLGGMSAAETVLDPARMVPFHVVRQELVFPTRDQDSLDAMIGGGRDAQLLPDGRVLILGAKGYLLLLDRSGIPRLLARPGEGPGELAGPEWMKVLADGRIAVWDGQLLRLSWYRADSGFQRAQRVELSAPDGRRVFPLGVTEDGAVIARIHGGYPTRDGVHINRADIHWIDAQGEPAERLMVAAPFSERHLQNLSGPGGNGRSIAMFTPPFARAGDLLSGSRRLCFVWTGAADVACTQAAKKGWTLLRDTSRGRRITDHDMDALLDSVYLTGVAPGRRAAQEDAVRGMPRADSMPRWGRGYLDVDDALWMPRYASVQEPLQRVWRMTVAGSAPQEFSLPRGDRIRWARGSTLLVERVNADRLHEYFRLELEPEAAGDDGGSPGPNRQGASSGDPGA